MYWSGAVGRACAISTTRARPLLYFGNRKVTLRNMQVQASTNFRDNLRLAMTALGITQEEVASKADLSRPYLNRILAGKQEPSLIICDRLADATRIPLHVMLQPSGDFQKFLRKVTREAIASL